MQRYGRDDDRRDDEYRGRNRELDESPARGIRDESERSAYSQSEYGDRYRFQNRDDERGRDRDEIRDFRRDVDERGRELNPRAAFYGGGFYGPGSWQWPVRQPYDVSRESGYYRDADSDWSQGQVREGRSFGGVSPQTGLGRRRDGGFFGRGPKGYTRSDERIQEGNQSESVQRLVLRRETRPFNDPTGARAQGISPCARVLSAALARDQRRAGLKSRSTRLTRRLRSLRQCRPVSVPALEEPLQKRLPIGL
jgi:hypothetical protein